MPQISSEQVAALVTLVNDGRSKRYAARAVGVHEATARRAIHKYEQTGSTARRVGSSRPRKTSPRDDRFLRLRILRDRSNTAVNVQQDLRQIRGVTISKQTVCRRLNEVNLKARRPAKGPKLLPQHRAARRNFVENYGQWNIREWSNVLFTDESRFCLNMVDGRKRVWRRTGERFNQNLITECESYNGGSVMVWGGISMNGKTPLHVFPLRQSMTALIYIDILQQYVLPRAELVGNNFILMQDNARPHTAAIVRNFLEATDITTLQWPARSPDMNPIEHLWDELGRRVRSRQRPAENLAELAYALVEEWNRIPMETIRNLISSMPRRLEALRVARGGNTRY